MVKVRVVPFSPFAHQRVRCRGNRIRAVGNRPRPTGRLGTGRRHLQCDSVSRRGRGRSGPRNRRVRAISQRDASSSSRRRTGRHRSCSHFIQGEPVAKKRGSRRYGRKAAQKVKRAMHERKHGTLRSGRSGKRVTSRKQAIAIGLSEARRSGVKVPKKPR
jgi:hypothetical protein